MKKLHNILSLFLFLLLQVISAKGQDIYFHEVLPPSGKSFDHVTGIVQDKQGFMWFATKRGLFSFDGFYMQSYKHNPLDINSLASDALHTIAVDQQGMLWIGTAGMGLDRYDPSTRTFTHFRHTNSDPSSLSMDFVSTVLVDKEGVLWVGTGNGLNRYDSHTGRFIHYLNDPRDTTSISANEIGTIYEDRNGIIWIGTGSVYGENASKADVGGLNKFNKKTGSFTRYKGDPRDPKSLINNKVSAITEDSNGNFWIGTAGDGLHTMDRSTGLFERHHYNPSHPDKLSRPSISRLYASTDHITFIKEDGSGAIWIGTAESGINYYNTTTQKVTHYESGESSAGSFTDRTAWAAYVSREAVLWISSLTGNLYRVNSTQKKIPFYPSSNGAIYAFYEDMDGTLWLGTEKGGLIRKDKANNVIQRFVHDPTNIVSIADNSVSSVMKDRQGNIWVGTNNGLDLFNREKGTFLHFKHHPNNSATLSSNNITTTYEDSKERIWIGTVRGPNLFDRKTGLCKQFIFYPGDSNLYGPNRTTSIIEDYKGQIWISGVIGGGIHRMDPVTGKIKLYLAHKTIVGIFNDSSNTIWAGGDNLYYYEPVVDTFYTYENQTLPFEITNIRSLMGDKRGRLWIANGKGILKINRKNESTFYGSNYGVDGTGLVYISRYEGPGGKLYFGHENGYYSFFDDSLRTGVQPPLIAISNMRFASKLVSQSPQSVLSKPLSETEKIVLPHNQNVFSFDYAVIDYTNPDENRQLFMLENYDNEWRQTGAEHRAYYFNVPPGKYTFRVKGANSYGIWAEKSIDITILPPWWRTWWAYAIYALLLLFILYWVHIYQRGRVIKKERQRSQARELEQAKKIEQAYIDLSVAHETLKSTQSQLIQSEKMASLGELTAGIAHEIQNPLNFINNFSDVNSELIDEANQEIDSGNLGEAKAILKDLKENQEKINHHGKRADAIVKGMLQHSRTSSGQKEPTDINALCEEYLRLAYHGLRAKDKSFNASFETHFDESIGKINVVPQDIGRVLLNLINNAFYAVNERQKKEGDGFKPLVEVSTRSLYDTIEIAVKDNGGGIPDHIKEKIFQPFFTTKPTGSGTGLGLSLSYDIVKAHAGELTVRTKEKEGTEFVLQLPIN